MTDNNIEQRILALGNYFRGLQVSIDDNNNKLVIVTLRFPDNWVIADELSNKFGVTVMKGNGSEYYFAIEISNGFSKVFDAVEYNIEKMKRAQERADLLKKKASELHNLFADENIPLEKLRALSFDYKENNIALPLKATTLDIPSEGLLQSKEATIDNLTTVSKQTTYPLTNDDNTLPSPMDYRNEPMPEDIPNDNYATKKKKGK